MIPLKEISSKEKLIRATIELMSARGFESMGINSILEAAEVSKSNFYYHFKSKEELCLAALDTMFEHFFSQYLDPVLGDKDISPKCRLQKLLENAKQKMTESECSKGCPFVNLSAETADYLPSFQNRIAQFYKDYAARLASCYEEGVKTGEFTSKISPEQAAQMILSLINGTMLMAKVQKDLSVLDLNTSTLFSIISAQQ